MTPQFLLLESNNSAHEVVSGFVMICGSVNGLNHKAFQVSVQIEKQDINWVNKSINK